jgi:hypothetical protein
MGPDSIRLHTSNVSQPSVAEATAVTLPSGKTIPLDLLMQAFISACIREMEKNIEGEERDLDIEREWKKGLEQQRLDEHKLIQEEVRNLKQTEKVREYGLGATLAMSGMATVLAGNLALGAAATVAGVVQILDQYFERRGSEAVASFFSSFLPVSQERCQDATLLFTTFASIAASIGLKGGPVLAVATGATKAVSAYFEGQITERRDEHKARALEIGLHADQVKDAIEQTLFMLSQHAEQLQQFQSLKFKIEKSKDNTLRGFIHSLTQR